MGEVSRYQSGDFTRFRERSPVPRANSAGRTCGGAARLLAAGSSSWGPGTGLCQVSRRDSRRAGAWSYRTFPPPCHSLAVALMSRKGRTTLYCGAQSVRSSRLTLCARCSRDDMPGGGHSAVLWSWGSPPWRPERRAALLGASPPACPLTRLRWLVRAT